MSESGKLIGIAELAKLIPGGPVHPATLRRWMSVGIRSVRLRSTLVGGRRKASASDVDEFIRAVTSLGNNHAPMQPTTAARKALASAENALKQRGY